MKTINRRVKEQSQTALRKVKKEFKERERFFTSVFESIQDGISILDKDMNIIQTNPVMERWYSHAMPLVGKKCYEVYHARKERCEVCPSYQTIEKKESAYEVVPKVGPGGKVVGWLDLYSFPLWDAKTGQMRGVIEYVRDITDRQRMEDELHRTEEETRRLAQENAITAEIGRIVGSTLNIDEVYERFAEELRKLISFDRVSIAIINHKNRTLTPAYVIGAAIEDHRPGRVAPLAGTVADLVAQKRSGIIIQPENEEEIAARYPGLVNVYRGGMQSKMSVPLISKDQVIGCLNFRSNTANAYTDRDLKLSESIANQIAGAIAHSQLFAERKQAEEALEAERQRFQILSEHAPFGMVMIDKDGMFRYINPKFKELFGYDLEDIPDGKTWFRKVYPDPAYRRNVISAWVNDLKIFAPGEKRPRVYTATCKDGTEKIINFMPVQLETGENLITCEDMTEHMRFEETMRESEERYRTLFEGSRDAVYITTREGRYVDFNKAFLDLFGYSKEELQVLLAQETYLRPDDRYQFQQEIEKKGFVSDYEIKLQKKDRREMNCLLTASIRRDNDGTILGYQGIIRDITERKRAEQEMKTLGEQLRQSQKMEAIGRLAGGIAHDFNNMLTIIKGYCQLSLSELNEDHPLRENLNGIQNATDRATDLIRKILAFSRRQVMEMKVIDLNALLKDLDKLLKRVIGEDIELVTVLAEDLGSVKADPGQIEQVILNLAVNAKDAMPKGGKVTIETANAELDETYARSHIAVIPGRYVMFSMSDTGVGMSPEIRERIFEPFFTTKEKDKGTGLGLSTVYGIVKQSGGNIWVYSEPGQGTTFKIYLPRKEELPDEPREKDAEQELSCRGETVLVVEDEDELRKLAVQILRKQGYKVLEAPKGEEALLISQEYEGPIHLLITDVVMPGMNGHDLSERLSSFRPDTKILFMSGHTSGAIIHHGVLGAGANLLQKPFTPQGLIRKVCEVLAT
ncbi:MAG: PAS domain S-box protein [Thermodesulfobacteriota bacterium]